MATAKLGVGILGSIILGTDSIDSGGPQAYGQAQADIQTTYRVYAQAQTIIITPPGYAGKIYAHGATHYWPLNDSGIVSVGTASASSEPFGATFNAAKVIDSSLSTGWATNAAGTNGGWWKEEWGSPVTARGLVLRARDSSNATPGTDDCPTSTVTLSDGVTSVDVPGVAVNGVTYVDFGGLKTFTWVQVTFTAGPPGGGNPGWSFCEVGGNAGDVVGGKTGFPSLQSAATYGATGPSLIANSAGITIPASDASRIVFSNAVGMPSGNSNRTVEFWAKTIRSGSATVIDWGATNTREKYAVVYNAAGLDIDITAHNDDQGVSVTGNAHIDGSYHYIAIVYDGTSKTNEVFFDGISIGTSGAYGANLNTSTSNMAIGNLFNVPGSLYFDGTISNLAVYSFKLTPTQIASHALGDGGTYKFGQAQAFITKLIVSGQAQADILTTYRVYGQAQAHILTVVVHAQAQADILQIYSRFAQAQADIKQIYNVFAQAQAIIVRRFEGFGQAQAQINTFDYPQFGQALALITREYTQVYGQASTTITGPPFISVINPYASAANSGTLTWTTPATAGNVIVIFVGTRDGIGVTPISDGWTSRASFVNVGVWTKTSTGGETSVTLNTSQKLGYVVIEVVGVAESTIKVGTNSGSGDPATATVTPLEGFPSIILPWVANGIPGDPGGWTPSSFVGYTQIATTGSLGAESPYDWLGYKTVGYAHDSYTPSITGVNNWNFAVISFARQPRAFAQAQATIHRYAGFAWAQAQIIRFEGYGQAQAFIGTKRIYGQAQAYISYLKVTQLPVEVLQYAQDPRTQVYQLPTEILERPQDVRVVMQQLPVEVLMKPVRFTYGLALAMISFWMAPAQAKAYILRVTPQVGQAQARIYLPPGWGQAQAHVASIYTFRVGQAQAFISKSVGYGQAQAKLNSTETKFAQAQGYVIHTWQTAQAQGYIVQFNINKFGQTQGYIRKSAGYGNVKAVIRGKVSKIAQAQGKIQALGLRGYGQAQTYILFTGQFAQAQALIGHLQFGQAQARIISFNTIRTGLARAYLPVPGGYLVRFNGYDLPGYAQMEEYISGMDINKKYIAYSDPFQEYLGLTNKPISLTMKVWHPEYAYQDVKDQTQKAATILRTAKDWADLYIQRVDRHYVALTKSIAAAKSVGESMRMLDYEVEFEVKPWLIEDQVNSLNGTTQIVASRTIDDGGWTPTIVTLTGSDITVSGYTQTESFTGFISVSGAVTDLIIDTENYTATINGVNQNFRIRNEDYRLYIGPETTYFAVSGASSCTIQYQNRFYL